MAIPASEAHVFFCTEAIEDLPQVDTGRGGLHSTVNELSAGRKNRMTGDNSLSTKNATELPKCSKSLHFVAGAVRYRGFSQTEQKTKKTPENCRSVAGFGVIEAEASVFWPGLTACSTKIWPLMCCFMGAGSYREVCMNGARPSNERRKWARLPLAIPVFVRSRDGKGKEFLEFATSLNVSAGGMLVAIRRSLPAVAQIKLEIPSAPVAAMALLPRAARTLRARTLRTTPADGYYLLGLKFLRPLQLSANPPARRRKLVANL